MAKVIAVVGLMLLAMVAFSEATSSHLVQATLKVTKECKKTDVLVLDPGGRAWKCQACAMQAPCLDQYRTHLRGSELEAPYSPQGVAVEQQE